MQVVKSNEIVTNLYILVMKHGHICYYGNSTSPFQLFLNRKEAEAFILKNQLGSLWRSTKATPEILADYFTGNL